MVDFNIREAVVDDCVEIMRLIQELADYENMSDGPQLEIATFQEDGFGKKSFYKCFVAEVWDDAKIKRVVGYALYYFTYSTWQGKAIYLEDIYVTQKYRNHGIGNSLLKAVAKDGIETKCCFMQFVCLGWNTPSLKFYKKRGAHDMTSEEDWKLMRLRKDEMVSISQS